MNPPTDRLADRPADRPADRLARAGRISVLGAVIALVFAGCAVGAGGERPESLKERIVERIGEHAAAVVVEYCERAWRIDQAALRERMDARTAPHTLRVECGP